MRAFFSTLFSLLPLLSLAQATPVVVADICPGGCSSSPSNLVGFGGKVYFFATSPTAGRELHVFDRTGVSVVADIATGNGNGIAPNSVLTQLNNKLYFAANDTAGAIRFYLYSYDGTSSPQEIILSNNNSIRSLGGTAVAGSDLVLGYNDSANRYQLAKYQPNTNTLQLITTGTPNAFGNYANGIIATNGYAYCTAYDYQNGVSASYRSFIVNLSTGDRLSLTTSVIASAKLLNDDVYFPYFDALSQYGGGHHIFRYRFSAF